MAMSAEYRSKFEFESLHRHSDPDLFGVATKNILEYFVSEFLGGTKNKGRSKVHFNLIEFLIIIRSADDKC